MTITELQTHPLFDLLRSSEKTFVLTYLTSNGDVSKSIRVSFPKVQSIQRKALALQKNETVSALLAYIDGEETPTKEAMIRLLWKTMRNTSNDFVRIKGAEIISDLQGYKEKPNPKHRAAVLDQIARKQNADSK